MRFAGLDDYRLMYEWRYRGFSGTPRHLTFLDAHPMMTADDADTAHRVAAEMMRTGEPERVFHVFGPQDFTVFTVDDQLPSTDIRITTGRLTRRVWRDSHRLASAIIMLHPGPPWILDWSAGIGAPPPVAMVQP